MKRPTQGTIILLLCVLTGLVGGCSKQESPRQLAEHMLELMNDRLPGTRLETDLSKLLTEPLPDGRYRIVYRDSTLTTDLFTLIKLASKTPFDKNKAESPVLELRTSRLKELSFIYGPKEKYLALEYMAGLSLETDLTPVMSKNPMVAILMAGAKIGASLDRISFDQLNMSHILREPGDQALKVKLENRRKMDSITFQSLIDNISFYLKANNMVLGNLQVLVKLGESLKITVRDEDRYIIDYFVGKETKKPDLDVLLKKNRAIIDFTVALQKYSLRIMKNGKRWGGGGIEKLNFSFFLGPDENRQFFKMYYNFSINGMLFNSPDAKIIEILTDLDEMNFKCSFSNLEPGRIMTLIDLTKEMMEDAQTMIGPGALNDSKVGMTKFWAEVLQSNPDFHYSLKPFKHYLGELELEADMGVRGKFPDLKRLADIKMTLFNMDETVKKISKTDALPAQWRHELLKYINAFLKKNEKGDGTLTYKLEPNQPGVAFLNGKEIKLPATQQNIDIK